MIDWLKIKYYRKLPNYTITFPTLSTTIKRRQIWPVWEIDGANASNDIIIFVLRNCGSNQIGLPRALLLKDLPVRQLLLQSWDIVERRGEKRIKDNDVYQCCWRLTPVSGFRFLQSIFQVRLFNFQITTHLIKFADYVINFNSFLMCLTPDAGEILASRAFWNLSGGPHRRY